MARYTKKTKRSRRKQPSALRGKILWRDSQSVQLQLPVGELLAEVGAAVESLMAEAGLLVIKGLIDGEVEQRAGQRYRHDPSRQAVRWGEEEGYVIFGGRKVPLCRPRVRQRQGREWSLERYRRFQDGGRMRRTVRQRILAGVSQRNYSGVIDSICGAYGVERSSVSRHWRVASAEQLRELLERPLGDLDLVAVLIDGLEFHNSILVVALGLDSTGKKHVLGLWPGATENAQVCQGLLDDLMRRGLATDRKYLFVVDGSKALLKAVRATFGASAEVQRCQVHKERNVLSQLPASYHGRVRRELRAAWKMNRYDDALKALQSVVGSLKGLNASAAASLQEGLQETLTVHRLGVSECFRRTLRSTNPIESCFSRTRELSRNVKRWQSQEMTQRWAGTMLAEAERRFRKVKGHRDVALLVTALRGKREESSVA